jgi:hypothetical protein
MVLWYFGIIVLWWASILHVKIKVKYDLVKYFSQLSFDNQ